MVFQNTTYGMDAVAHHYNARYNPMYGHQSLYLSRGQYTLPAGYRKSPRKPENASCLLAPLSAGIVSEIDFAKPYLNQDMDPVVGLFQDKAFFGKARIESIIHELGTRYRLMSDNVYALDQQICEVDSRIMRLPPHPPGLIKDLDRTRTTLEAEVLDLEQQKLRERTSAWKDMSRLKSDLVECLQEYASAQASGAFLDNYQGGQNH